jgi:hypothetical protein
VEGVFHFLLKQNSIEGMKNEMLRHVLLKKTAHSDNIVLNQEKNAKQLTFMELKAKRIQNKGL